MQYLLTAIRFDHLNRRTYSIPPRSSGLRGNTDNTRSTPRNSRRNSTKNVLLITCQHTRKSFHHRPKASREEVMGPDTLSRVISHPWLKPFGFARYVNRCRLAMSRWIRFRIENPTSTRGAVKTRTRPRNGPFFVPPPVGHRKSRRRSSYNSHDGIH